MSLSVTSLIGQSSSQVPLSSLPVSSWVLATPGLPTPPAAVQPLKSGIRVGSASSREAAPAVLTASEARVDVSSYKDMVIRRR